MKTFCFPVNDNNDYNYDAIVVVTDYANTLALYLATTLKA